MTNESSTVLFYMLTGGGGGEGGEDLQHVWLSNAHEWWTCCQQLHPAGSTGRTSHSMHLKLLQYSLVSLSEMVIDYRCWLYYIRTYGKTLALFLWLKMILTEKSDTSVLPIQYRSVWNFWIKLNILNTCKVSKQFVLMHKAENNVRLKVNDQECGTWQIFYFY